jgi:hypothetical protein
MPPEKVADLAEAPYNPRRISDSQLNLLRKAMLEFGDLSGIVYNKTTSHLIGGHQRVKHFTPDAEVSIDREFDPPTERGTVAEGHVLLDGERWTYREVEWDADREAAANIAANQHGGEFVFTELVEILSELDAGGYDATLTGFDSSELEKMLTGFVEDIGIAQGSPEGFAEGEQFKDYTEVLVEIWISVDKFEDEELKQDLQDFCTKHGLDAATRMREKK